MEIILDSKQVRENYSTYQEKIKSLISAFDSLDPNDEEFIEKAEATVKEAKDLVELVEGQRKQMQTPVLNFSKKIADLAGELTGPLTMHITLTNQKIIQFKVELQKQKKKKEEERLKREAEAEIERKKKIKDRLVGIRDRMLIRINGGSYETQTGTKTWPGCSTLVELDDMKTFMLENWPDDDSFDEFAKTSVKLREELVGIIQKKMEKVKEGESLEEVDVTSSPVLENTEIMLKNLQEQKYSEIGEAVATIEAKIPGTRRVWKAEVVDPLMVPEIYKMVDMDKIKNFIAKHKDQLKEGINMIPGVRFYRDITNVIKSSK